MSLMHLSLCKKLELLHLKPTTMIIQLADRTLRLPAGVLEDVPIHVGKFIIPCDFILMDMDESSQISIILRRPFLATVRAMIDVQSGAMSFQFCGERVDFCFPPSIPFLVPALPSLPEAPAYSVSHAVNYSTTVFDEDGGPHMRPIALSDLYPPILTTHGGTTFCPGDGGNTNYHFTIFTSLHPVTICQFEVMVKLRT